MVTYYIWFVVCTELQGTEWSLDLLDSAQGLICILGLTVLW